MQRWRLFSPVRIARLAHTAKKVSHLQRQILHFDDVRCVIAAAKHVSMLTLASSSKCIKPNVSNNVQVASRTLMMKCYFMTFN